MITLTTPVRAAAAAHRSVRVDGPDIFYREAGGPTRLALLLLLFQGFPSSSPTFRDRQVGASERQSPGP